VASIIIEPIGYAPRTNPSRNAVTKAERSGSPLPSMNTELARSVLASRISEVRRLS
jgi:hypothetical protein